MLCPAALRADRSGGAALERSVIDGVVVVSRAVRFESVEGRVKFATAHDDVPVSTILPLSALDQDKQAGDTRMEVIQELADILHDITKYPPKPRGIRLSWYTRMIARPLEMSSSSVNKTDYH